MRCRSNKRHREKERSKASKHKRRKKGEKESLHKEKRSKKGKADPKPSKRKEPSGHDGASVKVKDDQARVAGGAERPGALLCRETMRQDGLHIAVCTGSAGRTGAAVS